MKTRQRGNTVIGLIIGIVLGLGVALGIAVYVTKVPIPFMTKTQRGGAEQDEAEARKNKDWNPNAPLAGKPSARTPPEQPASVGPLNPAAPATGPVPAVVAPDARSAAVPARTRPEVNAPAASSDPLGDLARARAGITAPATTTAAADGTDPFVYFVQAGAFRSTEDAEAQRAKLSLMGVEARVTEREQAGRTVYRVRAGPFNKKDDADRLKSRLDSGGLESNLVRVQR
ncbi:SPOR domain-containing protein [Variovorax arabinosiphilus]|uniref:SPOR domain-containing protein n=1 Tax=Variovorax arabinosiphilus TaxID=3053498 RepID=UPI002577B356|nr:MULTISPECIES: SPOR domain-containing protein [unclassified Variovorax]MDM0122041.1 SPOR domain-containing protein [Variovorax sp. J2L1-78]MDM0131429.1 SPOR domain-containing protein [Variovorax sp. J2L1-63]MDM0234804.1 SPOR domain-containing protein [Variovorax sp. J2R1-6]